MSNFQTGEVIFHEQHCNDLYFEKKDFHRVYKYGTYFCRKIISDTGKSVKSILKNRSFRKTSLKVRFNEGVLNESLLLPKNSVLSESNRSSVSKTVSNVRRRGTHLKRKFVLRNSKKKSKATCPVTNHSSDDLYFRDFDSSVSPTIHLSDRPHYKSMLNQFDKSNISEDNTQGSISTEDIPSSPDSFNLIKRRRKRNSFSCNSFRSRMHFERKLLPSDPETSSVADNSTCSDVRKSSKNSKIPSSNASSAICDVKPNSPIENFSCSNQFFQCSFGSVSEKADSDKNDNDDSGFLCSLFDPL